ncbi:MAG: hypothetical protein ACRDUX_39265 [Mycobacterium sp.]
MATLPAETFTSVLRGESSVPSVTAAIAETVPRDLHTLQDASAEHAAMCARIFANGSAS